MAAEFTMPKLGLTMEEATVVEWLIADGAAVDAGVAVMRIETDKVETEVEISAAGVLHHVGQVGEVYRCGVVIGYVLSPGEAPPAAAQQTALVPVQVAVATPSVSPPSVVAIARDGRLFASPNARRIAGERGINLQTIAGSGPDGRIVSKDVPLPASVAALATSSRSDVVASIAARNLADLLGVDLAAVTPDLVEHRVTRDGVAAYVRQRLATSPPAQVAVEVITAAPPATLLQTPTRTIRLSGMRGTIAKRMTASLREMAQLTLTMDADMDNVVADRQRRATAGAAPGFTDYIIAAVARALVQHPDVNAQVTSDGIAVLPDVHVGLAVALDNGLLVPVVRHADRLSLADLAVETSRLAAAARGGKLSAAELEGATFSVSALGMFGVDAFTPVINPPNAAILGVGRLRDDVTLNDGQVGQTKRLTLSLTWDHRVLDGAPAASFCKSVVAILGEPADL
jgi:pyruvate dehydrogenase E2 component (dihydrolipoamide acetyltransferase)